jgi:hypothetical protein
MREQERSSVAVVTGSPSGIGAIDAYLGVNERVETKSRTLFVYVNALSNKVI